MTRARRACLVVLTQHAPGARSAAGSWRVCMGHFFFLFWTPVFWRCVLHWSKSSSLPRCTHTTVSRLHSPSAATMDCWTHYTGSSRKRCAGKDYNHNYRLTTSRMGNNDNLSSTYNPGPRPMPSDLYKCSCTSSSAPTRTSGHTKVRHDFVHQLGEKTSRASVSSILSSVSLTSPHEPLKRLFRGLGGLLLPRILRQGKRVQPRAFSSHTVCRLTSPLWPAHSYGLAFSPPNSHLLGLSHCRTDRRKCR